MTNKYKCKICLKKLTKPDDENEIFWDNMQILTDVLWRDDYRYELNNIKDPHKFHTRANGFKKVCRYKCCSQKCRTELMKRAGTYIN